jgi:hypothetical protein
MGLFWGTYNDIVQRADAGRKLGELQFRRYTGEGTLTAQIMGGASIARCFGGHTFFQIDADGSGRKWRYARMRIGSDEQRRPVWLEIPIVYHRDLPSSVVIKSLSMTRRAGRWQLNVAVNQEHPNPRQGPRIAVDIGWRLLPEGVRVAYWADENGGHGQVLVISSDIGQLQKVESLRSKCDLLRDEFLPTLCVWLDGQELTEQWKQQTVAISQWRSSDRIARLVRWWADNRSSGDEEIFDAAIEWRKRYLHLANWWRNLEDQTRLRRREQDRIFAAGVARKYGELLIEDFDLREVAQDPAPESSEVKTASSGYRQKVSPSIFRSTLLNASQREGVKVMKLQAGNTTRKCHTCGNLEQWDQREDLIHRCGRCDALWDQDYNAAMNLLRSEHASGSAPPTQDQGDSSGETEAIPDRSQTGFTLD